MVTPEIQKTLLRTGAELEKDVYFSADFAARSLALLPGFNQFNVHNPPQASQGSLTCLYELQQILCSWSGFEAVSLAPVSNSQATFACLAMIRKYHQRKKQPRNKILYLQGVKPAVLDKTIEMGYEATLVNCDQIVEHGNEGVSALLLPLFLLETKRINEDHLNTLRQKGIIIVVDGLEETPFAQSSGYAESAVDIMHLDLGHLCGVSPGTGVVLTTKKLHPYLPTPWVSCSGTVYQWEVYAKNPFSIGPLSSTVGNIEALLECYVHLKLQGIEVLQQQALTNIIYAACLIKELSAKGLQQSSGYEVYSGICKFEIESSAQSLKNLRLLSRALNKIKPAVDIQLVEFDSSLRVSLRHLHVLEIGQLDKLVNLIIKHLRI